MLSAKEEEAGMESAKTLKNMFNWYMENWREGASEMGGAKPRQTSMAE